MMQGEQGNRGNDCVRRTGRAGQAGDRVRSRARPIARTAFALAAALAFSAVHAYDFETGESDLKLRWDNTFKYSTAYRMRAQSSQLVNDAGNPIPGLPGPVPQLDDGDRNFNKGIISDRFDLLSELDVGYKNFGGRVSGAAWYDSVYNTGNDNTSQATVNSASVPAGQFTRATKVLMGRDAEVLDAFVYMKGDTDSATPYTVRAGRHTLLYGESLFFGSNGIAGGQSPIDLIKLLQVPGSQFKEIIRPVDQISTQIQLRDNVSVGAYYQLHWEENRIPASGSYLSDADFVGAGAETLLGMHRVADFSGKNTGAGGLQVRFTPYGGDTDFGLYAIRYNDRGPQIMLSPGFAPFNASNTYRLVYADGVQAYGASASTALFDANVAAEISMRTNAPLVSDPQIDIPLAGNGSSNPLYAVGRTGHAQISSIYLMHKGLFWDGATWLQELAWNRTLSVQKNPLALDPNTTRDAMAYRTIFEPAFFQVFPAVDMTMPIGIGWNPYGLSSAVFKFNGGVEHGGDFSIGLTANYKNDIKATLNYVHFLGTNGAFLTPYANPARTLFALTGAQSLADRDFISFSIQSTF